MDSVVVDVDGTLVVEGRMSRFFFRLASLFQALGRRRQRPNRELLARLVGYDRVIVLTGRDIKDAEFTKDQLRRAGFKFDEIICAPRTNLLTRWKIDTVDKMQVHGNILWVDDFFRDPSLRTAVSTADLKVSAPEDLGGSSAKAGSTFDGL